MLKIAVICVGDELLKGSTVNTDLAFIGERLTGEGAPPVFAQEVPDSEGGISEALDRALSLADCVITSGGLGPTADDLTKEIVAQRLGLPLQEDAGTADRILRFWKTRHRTGEIPQRVFKQALVPAGAQVIPNEVGTAPGLVLRITAQNGAQVAADEEVLVMESMKMEMPMKAPKAGVVTISVAQGDKINSGDTLFTVA